VAGHDVMTLELECSRLLTAYVTRSPADSRGGHEVMVLERSRLFTAYRTRMPADSRGGARRVRVPRGSWENARRKKSRTDRDFFRRTLAIAQRRVPFGPAKI